MPPVQKVPRSPMQMHKEKWKEGCGSEECSRANKVCFGRGDYPCDILFLGEAPGASENNLGQPFVGPAGHLLDRIVENAVGQSRSCPRCRKAGKVRVLTFSPADGEPQGFCGCGWRGRELESDRLRAAFTNLVGCLPSGEDGKKSGEPSEEQIESCIDRLKEFVAIVRPQLIVCVGQLAKTWTEPGYRHSIKFVPAVPLVDVQHPAYILRQPIAHQGLLEQRATVTIRDAVEKHLT